MKKIFIIIVHFGDPKETNNCIESLYKSDNKFEKVIIVDNNQNYKISSKLKHKKEIKIILNSRNLGFAKGANIGIKNALKEKADYILLLNNDAIVSLDIVSELTNFLSINNSAGIVAPSIRFKKEGKMIYDLGGKINKIFGRTTHVEVVKINSRKEKEVDYVSGCAMFIRSSIIEKIGVFDPNFFLYYEDVDFCLRAKRAGFKIFVLPSVYINHSLSKSVGKNSVNAFYNQTKSALIFGKKYFSDRIVLNRIFILTQSLLILLKNPRKIGFIKAFRYI